MRVVGRPTVIVADDHPRVLRAATSILANSCDVVASVPDGPSVIAAADRLHPDVVVLDIEMPGCDGLYACMRIRSRSAAVRIVLLSSYADDELVLIGLARGASGFVAKSRMVADLPDAVAHVHAGRTFVPAARLVPRWRRADVVSHALQMFSTDGGLMDSAVAFLDSALDRGDPIIAISTADHREIIDRELSARGHGVARLRESDRYAWVDAAAAADDMLGNGGPESALIDGLDPLVEKALATAAGTLPRVCLFGEITAVLHARGLYDEMLEVEQIGHDFVAARPVSLLCTCAVGLSCHDGHDLVAPLCHLHSMIVPASPHW